MDVVKKFMVKKPTKVAIKNALYDVFKTLLMSNKRLSKDFVSKYGNSIVNLILAPASRDDDLCPVWMACSEIDDYFFNERFQRNTPNLTPVSINLPQCSLGKIVIDVVKEFVVEKPTKVAIENALYDVFKTLLMSNKRLSKDFVSKYGNSIVNLILAPASTDDDLCPLWMVCSEMENYVPNERFQRNTPNLTPVGINLPQCSLGKIVMDVVKEFVVEKPTKVAIENALYDVFKTLLMSNKRLSKDFVSKYGNSIVNLILAPASTDDEFCPLWMPCSEMENYVFNGSSERKMQKSKLAGFSSPECSLDEIIMPELKKLMIEEPTKAAKKNAFYNMCNALPKSDERSCKYFMAKYGNSIVDLMIAPKSNDELCPVYMICSELYEQFGGDLRRTAPTVRRVSTVTFSDCSLGKMVMDVIREFMGEKPSKAAIENALYNSFEALLGPNQRMSNDFASASSIADVILASRSGPDDICVLNVVCSEISHYFDTDKAKRRMQQPALVGVPSRDCSLGKLIMPRVEELMANAPTKEAIKNTLYSIYDALPISHARSSEDFVVRFGKPLTDLVVNRMSGDSDICPVHLACDELYEMDKEYKD